MTPTNLQLLQLKSMEYRGLILHEASILEKMIEGYISRYFFDTKITPDLNNAFVVTILDRLSFDGKISILECLLEMKYGKLEFKSNHSKLFTELRKSKIHRNIFAHYIVDIYDDDSVSKYPNAIVLIGFRNSVIREEYSDTRVDQILGRMRKCCEEIHKRIQDL